MPTGVGRAVMTVDMDLLTDGREGKSRQRLLSQQTGETGRVRTSDTATSGRGSGRLPASVSEVSST